MVYLFYGVFVQDLKDPLELLHPRNVNKTALYEYIRHGGTLRLMQSRLFWITTGVSLKTREGGEVGATTLDTLTFKGIGNK
jgi:hypothetical protein